MDLKGRDFLTLKDFTPEEIRFMLDRAKELKEKKKNGIAHRNHEGKNIALIFVRKQCVCQLCIKRNPIIICRLVQGANPLRL